MLITIKNEDLKLFSTFVHCLLQANEWREVQDWRVFREVSQSSEADNTSRNQSWPGEDNSYSRRNWVESGWSFAVRWACFWNYWCWNVIIIASHNFKQWLRHFACEWFQGQRPTNNPDSCFRRTSVKVRGDLLKSTEREKIRRLWRTSRIKRCKCDPVCSHRCLVRIHTANLHLRWSFHMSSQGHLARKQVDSQTSIFRKSSQYCHGKRQELNCTKSCRAR